MNNPMPPPVYAQNSGAPHASTLVPLATASDRTSVGQKIMAVLCVLLAGSSLAFAGLVLVPTVGGGMAHLGSASLRNWQNLPEWLASLVILNVFLLGFMMVRKTQTLDYRTRERDVAGSALEQSEARLRLAQAAAGIATTDWDIAADKAVLSSNFSEVFGTRPNLAIHKSPYEAFISLVHPADQPRIDAMHLRLLRGGGTFSDEFRVCAENGEIRWIATRGEVFVDSMGIARRLIGSNFDITERRRNEEKLKQSLNILELANDAGEIGVWDNDFMAKKATIDQRTRHILGLPDEEQNFSFTRFILLLHPADQEKVKSAFVDARRSGLRFAVECRFRRVDGNTRWVRISGQADMDLKTRKAVRMTGIVFDITDRREREQHLRFLMREITHRSKNLLAVINAMARQTKSSSRTLDEFQNLFSARLHGLSASHDLLVKEDWHGAWLDDIIRSQIAHFLDIVGTRIFLDGPRLQIKPEAAQNIGMAIHELATNAVKFGALSNEAGTVAIAWGIHANEAGEERLTLNWQERDGPVVEAAERRGFGSIVTERIVPRALEGRVQLSFAPAGVIWSLDIPGSFVLSSSV